eukprot:CAMPEP_0167803688 /NCGR_PEP_ID=MMETSP0111_2-20121227/19999_1 /TAXON_ID=91324 /ORGANISM="Lotharella globosa, Strain CCCM811" /LENGTH=119 /DNA_ID=CAMNT_0007700233 /DNA_START=258 /DNA_END=614 /DNA_ORIENTATION=-
MTEEIAKDGHPEFVATTKRIVDIFLQSRFLCHNLLEPSKSDAYWAENPGHLSVLVNEYESVRDVVVAKMDYARSNPIPNFLASMILDISRPMLGEFWIRFSPCPVLRSLYPLLGSSKSS